MATVTTASVHIGLKQYVSIMETGEVFVMVPEKWDYSGAMNIKVRERYWLPIKAHTPKWYEVRKLAKGVSA